MIKTLLLIAGLSLAQPQGECHKDCRTSDAGVQLVKTFEGYSPYIYKDSAGLDTIGIGHLIKAGEVIKQPLLGEDARELLKQDLRIAERAVNKNVNVKLKQHQFDPLASWTFNLGAGALKDSTMLRKINAQKHAEVPEQMLRWVKAGGRVIKGLVRRREAEAAMYAGL